MTYTQKLAMPEWKAKRKEILNRDKEVCQECGKTSQSNHAHHQYYKSRRQPWDYPDFCFITLCDKCHKKQHSKNAPWKGEEFFEMILRTYFAAPPQLQTHVLNILIHFNEGNDDEKKLALTKLSEATQIVHKP
jgi:5-methylcytosine-specific restriction endonuclease McrA